MKRLIKKIDINYLEFKTAVVAISIFHKLLFVFLYIIVVDIITDYGLTLLIYSSEELDIKEYFKRFFKSIQLRFSPYITFKIVLLIVFSIAVLVLGYIILDKILSWSIKFIIKKFNSIERDLDEAVNNEKPKLFEAIKLLVPNLLKFLLELIKNRWFQYFIFGAVYKFVNNNFSPVFGVLATFIIAIIFTIIRVILFDSSK